MKFSFILKWPMVLFATLSLLNTSAQRDNILAGTKTSDGRYNFVKFEPSKQRQSRNVPPIEQVKSVFGLGAGHSFVRRAITKSDPGLKNDSHGLAHIRYNQYFKNVKVEYGVVTLHLKNTVLDMVTGSYFNIKQDFSTTPAISENTAFNNVILFIGAKKYSWQDSSIKSPPLKDKPRGALVICQNFLDHGNTSAAPEMELAYKFAVYATQPLRYDYIYISARTGKVILVNPIIKHADGTGATRYSGSRTIATTQLPGGTFVLKDSGAEYNIATFNLNRGSNYSGATNFSDSNNNWTSAEFDNSNYDNAALDAHWGAMMTLDYWRTVHQRNSFDNNGARINSYVHYGYFYSNAFWDGYEMTYGDGDGSSMFPLTSVDICGHEIGHAVCENTADLIYAYEPGALNEGFSDIWGACIKEYADSSKNIWLLGDEISGTGHPIRSMINPKSEGQPDTYKGINWYTGNGDNGGVHYNSGVINHWFYILTEGKSGTNDNGTAYNVSGIGITKAAQIAYRAENIYLYPSAVYADAKIYTQQAAEDLFGTGSNEAAQTAEAWKAVGVREILAIPDSVTAVVNNGNIVVSWRFNQFQSINGFKIERAINGNNQYAAIDTLGAGVRSLTDSGYINNSINQYRIRSFKNDVNSDYSAVASVAIGNAPLIMINGSFNTCGNTFLDPGGMGNYNTGYYTTTIRPTIIGNKLQIVFNEFNVSYDNLYIYNGPSASSPLIGAYYGTNIPPILKSTAPGGELTFVFNPYYSNSPGWLAYINCFKPVAAPSGLTGYADSIYGVHLSWTDNANDETHYVVERSFNDSLHYSSLVNLPANTAGYVDTAAPDNSYIFYRVRAYRDSVASPASEQINVINGNLYIMTNGTVTACGITFLDPGGFGNYSNSLSYTTTFRPSEAAKKIKVVFDSFSTEPCCDYLRIYNGPSVSSPLLGSFSGTSLPPVLESSAPNGELTFQFYADGSAVSTGWHAYISCYKPVLTPTRLSATTDTSRYIKLTWRDNANDETAYVVERSVNAPAKYNIIARLPASSNKYSDSTAPANSLLYYRVRAYRDSVGSHYSDTAALALGNAPFLMKDSTVITCDKVFMDPGGVDVIPANIYHNEIATFKPSITGNKVRVVFSKFMLNGYLYVYDGPNTSSPLLGYYNGTYASLAFEATGADGSLTFYYQGYSYGDSGWIAKVSCYKPVSKPTGLNAKTDTTKLIKLTWKDNASDETGYVVERSTNAPAKYTIVAQLSANSNKYTDSSATLNSLLYYRVRAYRDSLASFYSDTAIAAFGNAPFLMKDSSLITCDKVFMDPGGVDVIPSNIYHNTRATFKPAISGNKLKIVFSKFVLNGYLYVYDGPSVNSSLIGSYNGVYPSLSFEATGADGSLTFYYQGYSFGDSGWIAQVSCYKPLNRPTGLRAIADTMQLIKLTWKDNANDETGYVVERSVNAPAKYTTVAQLTSNSNKYTDSTAPVNSLLYYRVRAYRDTLGSFYSDTAAVAFGNAPFLMKDSTLITCDKVYMDPGGVDVIPPGFYYITRATFKPAITGNRVKVVFSKFILQNTYMNVYDGPNTNSPFIGIYFGTYPSLTFEATGADGSLTFHYQGYPVGDSGWIAQVSCFKPVNKPGTLTVYTDSVSDVHLTWADNASNETGYALERSFNDSLHYSLLINLPSNSSAYIDTSAPDTSYIFYRVRAYKDANASLYSNSVSVTTGNLYVMQNGTLSSCSTLFLDPGGPGNYDHYANFTTTVAPFGSGKVTRVVFSAFNTESCCDRLRIYNGPNIYSPLLGIYSGSSLPSSLQSTATNGELTFNFISDGSITGTGWKAYISCIAINDTLNTCSADENDVNTFVSDLTGTSYRWQQYKGGSFTNIYDNTNISGTTTASLQVKNAGLTIIDKFRCVVNGGFSREFVVIKGNRWKGTVSSDWHTALNWSCGSVPDYAMDVLVEANTINSPVVNSDAECRSLKLMPGVNLTVATGFKLHVRH